MQRPVPSYLPTSRRLAAAGIFALTAFLSIAPAAQAATSKSSTLEYSGWIPYWATAAGTADAKSHTDQLTEINPFGYSAKSDGSLADTANLGSSAWQSLFSQARKDNVKVVPTIMWSDTASIYNVLSNPALRAVHVQNIVNAVSQNGFNGIDIDYEGKTAETRPYFSAFLSELSTALAAKDKNLTLDCTIEARMPLSARYSGTPPANIEYANDLQVINKVCDRVRIMTYDQQTADLQLNAAHSKDLYAPVADTAWVKKVVDYMDADIEKSKIMLGVATYGGEYQAMSNTSGTGFAYTKTSSFNPTYAVNLAKQYNITPTRNASGELSFSYVDKNQTTALPTNDQLSKLAPKGTASGSLAAAGALAYSKSTSRQAPVTFVTWSDAEAIQDKAELAKSLGVAGIAIFKIDGGEDPAMWSKLSDVASAAKRPVTSRVTNLSTSIPTAPVITPIPTTPPGTTATVPVPPTTSGMVTTNVPISTGAFTKDLQYGNENTDVTRMQAILIKKGFMKVAANGYFGPATKAALSAWQSSAGLPPTGYFGPLSRAKIGS